ncbi:BadF/BadG/BcrA/BcrD ATPase family protein [Chthonobacter rhizosphaerae]|uniref:BadF/BadG/BcrA/BcrD ATPase family protein n=1 Tax=Chthonobacter rhizosphaerae TaxID=2735553 RepID=UPI001AED61EE
MADGLFLGIDGGGTVCRARLADASGRVLGEGAGGPANITTAFDLAIESILTASRAALAAAGLGEEALARTSGGFGLAGGNAPVAARRFLAHPLPFAHVAVASDADIACLGAHGGGDGGILILGTGSQGVVRVGDRTATVGGWGFMVSDTGSGATLGRRALRRALLGFEDVESRSAFTDALMAVFDDDPAGLLAWSLTALPRDWARHAPLVFEHARAGDPIALMLVRQSADDIGRLLDRMMQLGARRISLMGGVAEPHRPYLHARFETVLVPPRGDALDGALTLAGLPRAT